MRVIGGEAKGHRLQVPQTVADLRPSQELVRESVFNILGDVTGWLVLDLYAGTGALGIEALSRGARFCDFVEKSKDACAVIEQNLNHTKLRDRGDIYNETAAKFLNQHRSQTYDLIFLDPPYVEQPRDVFRLIPANLTEGGILIYLHAQRIILTDPADREWIKAKLKQIDTRKYGATHVSLLVKK